MPRSASNEPKKWPDGQVRQVKLTEIEKVLQLCISTTACMLENRLQFSPGYEHDNFGSCKWVVLSVVSKLLL